MARARLAFLITWGVLWVSAQIPLLILFSAFNFNNIVVAVGETLGGIFTAIMTAMMMVKEDYNGEEIRNKKQQ